MLELSYHSGILAALDIGGFLGSAWSILQIFIGFSFIIFVHELGHFLVAKWAGVRVEQFAIGFFREVFGFTRGETRYSFNLLPLGGYVKMLGQEDFEVDTTGELQFKDDPRSFANKPVGVRMAIVSAGVIMNLILAGILFMIVFLVGKEVLAARVGSVAPDSPAAMAGIQPGDIIHRIDGSEIDEFAEINMAIVLSEPGKPLDFEIERNGEIKHVSVTPERNPERDLFQIGITSPHSPVLMGVGPEYDVTNPNHPRPGDKIVEIGGREVTDQNANEMIHLLMKNPRAFRAITVERPVHPTQPDSPLERVTVDLSPRLQLWPSDVDGNPPHLLGLVPLMRFSNVEKGGRADLAGIEVGDIILQWDGIRNPTINEIDKSIAKSATADPDQPEQDIPIVVRRARTGKIERLVVRPRVKIIPILNKRKPPTIDAQYRMYADDTLIVGSIVPEVMGEPTPAAQAGIPADALITRVDSEPVQRWIDLAEALRVRAGKTVTITYTDGDAEGRTVEMKVPPSLRTALGIGPESVIVAIDGKEKVNVELNNRSADVTVSHPLGQRAALEDAVGKSVEVKYRPTALAELQTAQVQVTEDMVYPWVGLIEYTVDLVTAGETTILRKSNPIAALKVGVKKTYYFVIQVYQVMQRMIFSRSLGVENISGPVGIVQLGSKMAEQGIIQLLFFLAIISANLAVINFLPLPIVDGGLMVFLIIEKIKGSPISVRIQVATQVVGLILIISAFAFVTIMDLTR